jgi:hypothetical protein
MLQFHHTRQPGTKNVQPKVCLKKPLMKSHVGEPQQVSRCMEVFTGMKGIKGMLSLSESLCVGHNLREEGNDQEKSKQPK